MSVTVSLVTLLHVLQAAIWASCCMLVGAIPTAHLAMLYSIGAMATHGHATVYLDAHWQMPGAMKALNGAILLGLSTACLYAMMQQAWPGEKELTRPWRQGSHRRSPRWAPVGVSCRSSC